MLKFSPADSNDRNILLNLTKDTLSGAEAFTFIKLHETIPEEAFFCGKDENGKIGSIIFNNGDEYIKVYGSEFPPLFSFSEKCIFVYGTNNTIQEETEEISGSKLTEFYKLISQSEHLSYDNERRYVERMRAVNHGYSKVFAVYDNKKIISSAAVSAQNEKYCLIADVFTHPDYRCKGYARKCINSCISYTLSINKKPFLLCEEKMCSYYEKLGFTYYGKM